MGAAVRLSSVAGSRGSAWRKVWTLASLSLAVVAGVVVIPRQAGAAWGTIAAIVMGISVPELVAMTAVWALGLLAYSTVLTIALPGLSRTRALTLNLTGSAVSNLLPLGGAAGVGLNFRMVRSWGFPTSAFVSFTVVTHLVNVAAKLALPAAAVALLALTGTLPDQRFTITALVAVAVLCVGLGLVALGVRRAGTGEHVRSHGGGEHLRRRRGRLAAGAFAARAREALYDTGRALSRGWWHLTSGMTAYSASHVLLLWIALHAVHSPVGPAGILAAYAAERLLTVVPLTPGGAGLVEVGMTGVLLGLGGSPAATAAGVLIYRAFVFGLEIPVGGVWLLSWLWSQHRSTRLPRRAVSCESSM